MAIAAQCLALEPKKTRLGMAGTPRSGPLAEFVRPVSLQRAVLKLLPWCLCCSVADYLAGNASERVTSAFLAAGYVSSGGVHEQA
jgi:hypothetical protein